MTAPTLEFRTNPDLGDPIFDNSGASGEPPGPRILDSHLVPLDREMRRIESGTTRWRSPRNNLITASSSLIHSTFVSNNLTAFDSGSDEHFASLHLACELVHSWLAGMLGYWGLTGVVAEPSP